MSLSFRNAVFSLCKKLQKNEDAQMIKTLITSLNLTRENKTTGEIKKCLHGDFAQLAKQSNNQFLGYLFVDDNADKLQLPAFVKLEHLTSDERVLIERGHQTLMRLIELCLSDICKKSRIVADAMNPYYLFKKVTLNSEIKPLLDDNDYEDVVRTFKNGRVYKALYDSDIALFFNNVDLQQMQALISIINKEFSTSYCDDVSSDLRNLSMRLMNEQINAPDALYAFVILIYALKESLRMTCQLLFGAICGDGLIVLNNENLINIESKVSSQICNFYKVFVQGCIISVVGHLVGDILLIDCDDCNNEHIHEFGMITSTTIQFIGEYGQTSKISFIIVDDELIPISNITQTILRHGLPKMIIH